MKAIFLINFNLYFNVSTKQLIQNNSFIDFLLVSGGLAIVTMKFIVLSLFPGDFWAQKW